MEEKEIVHVIQLYHPIQFGSKLIEELEFRETDASDMRSLKQDMTIGEYLDIAHRICGQPKAAMNKLKPSDVMQVIDYLGNALTGGV